MAKIIFNGPIITGKYMGGIIQSNNSGYFFRSLSKSKLSLQASQIIPADCLKAAAQMYKGKSATTKSSWNEFAMYFYPRRYNFSNQIYNGANAFIGHYSAVLFAQQCANGNPFYTAGGVDFPFSCYEFILPTGPPSKFFIGNVRVYNTNYEHPLSLASVDWDGKSTGIITLNLQNEVDISEWAPPYNVQFYDIGSPAWFGYFLFCSEPLPYVGASARNTLRYLVGIFKPIVYPQGQFPVPGTFPMPFKVRPQTNFAKVKNTLYSGANVIYTLYPITQHGQCNSYYSQPGIIT